MKRLTDLSDAELMQLAHRIDRDLPDAPAWLVESAVAMWRAPSATPPLARRLAAVLSFDSWAAQPMPALRSAAASARQLLFTAQGCDIDLRLIADAGAGFRLAGQVLGQADGGQALLARDGATLAVTAIDDFGEFGFDALDAGVYVLSLSFGEQLIELPEIELGGAVAG